MSAEIKQKWVKSRPEYYVQTGGMHENPYGVPRDEIDRFIRENPPEVVAQVVFGKYVENSGLVFTAELVNQMVDRSIPRVIGNEWRDDKRWYQSRIDQERAFDPYRFSTGVDLARKKDYTVITVIDRAVKPARVVYYKRINRAPWPQIYAEIGRAQHFFPGELLVDATGSGGDVILEELESRLYCPEHHSCFEASHLCPHHHTGDCSRKRYERLNPEGFIFTSSTKVQLINHLQAVLGSGYRITEPDVEFGALRVPPISQLEEEMSVYAWDDKKLETDCVMSLALAAWGLQDIVFSPAHIPVFGV